MKYNPKISIITVVYNGEQFLEKTILSVVQQTYKNIEYIIIDGGSTDGTVDIIKKYEDKINYWISEVDNGIYDAINKGLKIATGDYIGVIGSDDIYYQNAIENIVNAFNQDLTIELIYGNLTYIDKNGHAIQKKKSAPPNSKLFMIKGMSVPHVASFVKRSIYKEYGDYKTDIKYAADYDYYLNLYLNKVKFTYVDTDISKFRNTGVTNKYMIQSNFEVFQIRKKYGINFFINVYYLFRTISSKYLLAFKKDRTFKN